MAFIFACGTGHWVPIALTTHDVVYELLPNKLALPAIRQFHRFSGPSWTAGRGSGSQQVVTGTPGTRCAGERAGR